MFDQIVQFIKSLYRTDYPIPLHEPKFTGNEKKYIEDCIDSTFVSSVGKYVDRFEKEIAEYTGSRYAVATMNGTAALHLGLVLSGLKASTEVLVQPLTFIATVNAIRYCNADPVFIDIEPQSLGMCPDKLSTFLKKNSSYREGKCINKNTGNEITACLPMHTFGHPLKIDEIINICAEYGIPVVEDAAESVGSFYKEKHTGTFASIGILSFNGNKIITTGGGGMILTNDEKIAKQAKYLSTQAKIPHPWEYNHDQVGYNYRLPNINAALGCAQLENVEEFVSAKREIANKYKSFFNSIGLPFISEPVQSRSNYWLNSILFNDQSQRDDFLKFSNEQGVLTRPAWKLISALPMYKKCYCGDLSVSKEIEIRLVNIPSSVI